MSIEVIGRIKKIDETQVVGTSGFRKRDIGIITNEQYPQTLLIQFVQDKVELLNNYKIGQDVKISINLQGRIWVNPEGEDVYFNTLGGWRIALEGEQQQAQQQIIPQSEIEMPDDTEPDDLPF